RHIACPFTVARQGDALAPGIVIGQRAAQAQVSTGPDGDSAVAVAGGTDRRVSAARHDHGELSFKLSGGIGYGVEDVAVSQQVGGPSAAAHGASELFRATEVEAHADQPAIDGFAGSARGVELA